MLLRLFSFLIISLSASLHFDSNVTKTIIIQPFGNFSKTEASAVFQSIKKLYPHVILKEPIALPSPAFYKPRNRYKADSLLNFLSSKIPENDVVIGLTEKDISTTKGKYKDWGVMGLGFCPGNACVVSTFRLKKDNLSSQFYKVAIHELGHTQGLQHCTAKTCLMRDGEGKNNLDNEFDFCEKCKFFLKTKGWNFN